MQHTSDRADTLSEREVLISLPVECKAPVHS